MGSHKSETSRSKHDSKKSDKRVISILLNSLYFFLHDVIVLKEGKNYKLIVKHNDEFIVEKNYKTLRGAKIAFSKMFQYKAVDEEHSYLHWSPLYSPEPSWLAAKLSVEKKKASKRSPEFELDEAEM